MYSAELSISDYFLELGNRFFNVQNNEWAQQFELDYEEDKSETINYWFVDGEEKIDLLHQLLWNIIASLQNLFKRKTEDKLNVERMGTDRMVQKQRRASSVSHLNSQQVIVNNVRNRLLKTINEGMPQYGEKRQKSMGTKWASLKEAFGFQKKKSVKNQLMTSVD